MPLPLLYDRWLREVLLGPAPEERRATCESCPLVSGETPRSSEVRYDPSVKCCTYLPELPNFLVGLALLSDDPAGGWGRDTLADRTSRGSGVSPLGLRMTPLYRFLYDKTSQGVFGRSPSLRCPHFQSEDGSCGIWQFRNGVCATWFCRHERGRVGELFWNATKRLLGILEEELAWWCLLELDLAPDQLSAILTGVQHSIEEDVARELVDGADAARAMRLWGKWHGRELELYLQCGRLVGSMPWAQVRTICGTRLRVAEQEVRRRHYDLNEEAHTTLVQLGSFRVHARTPEIVRISAYRATDILEVPVAAMDAIMGAHADAATQNSSLSGLEPDLLRALVDHGVLDRQSSDVPS